MNHLLRSQAPMPDSAWEQLDAEGRQRLVPALAARKLVEFSGPHGWQHSASNLGRSTPASTVPVEGLSARQRKVMPLVELRAPFTVSREELLDTDRGALDTDFSELDRAAARIAQAENIAVFHGWEAAGIAGIRSESGSIVGLMPHPEHAIDALTGPGEDGLGFFTSAVRTLAAA